MSILTWNLTSAPSQAPEYWLLCVDGNALCSLTEQAPYTGAGKYSVDLMKLDSSILLPTDGAPHQYSVVLVGSGVAGPQSPSVAITLPISATTVVAQLPPPPVWPVADTLTTQ